MLKNILSLHIKKLINIILRSSINNFHVKV